MPAFCLICSAARSGSTLLDRLLGSHSSAVSLGEISFLNKAISLDQICSCGVHVSVCQTWGEILDRISAETGADLRLDPYAMQFWDARASVLVDKQFQTPYYIFLTKIRTLICDIRYKQKPGNKFRFPLPSKLKAGLHNSIYLYNLLADEWNKTVLIDSSKNVHKALAVYEQSSKNTRVIYQTRDGRGVYHSRRSSGFSSHQSASAWHNYNRRASSYLSNNIPAKHLFRLKYEDLVSNPTQVLTNICDFLELEFEDQMLNFADTEHHLVNGNDMRLKQTDDLKLDERWKQEMTDADLTDFNRLTGSMNQKLGYE